MRELKKCRKQHSRSLCFSSTAKFDGGSTTTSEGTPPERDFIKSRKQHKQLTWELVKVSVSSAADADCFLSCKKDPSIPLKIKLEPSSNNHPRSGHKTRTKRKSQNQVLALTSCVFSTYLLITHIQYKHAKSITTQTIENRWDLATPTQSTTKLTNSKWLVQSNNNSSNNKIDNGFIYWNTP